MPKTPPMPDHYIITHVHEDHYFVWNEHYDFPYEIHMDDHSCTCPHWQIRLRKAKTRCKHQDWVISEGAWNVNPFK